MSFITQSDSWAPGSHLSNYVNFFYITTVPDLRCTVCLYFTGLLSLTYGELFVCVLQDNYP